MITPSRRLPPAKTSTTSDSSGGIELNPYSDSLGMSSNVELAQPDLLLLHRASSAPVLTLPRPITSSTRRYTRSMAA
jgi:hypothetical protein